MNNVLEEIIQSGVVKSPEGETSTLHSHIDFDQGYFLQKMMSETKREVSLEVGLAYGISALFICDWLIESNSSRHIVIDPFQLTYWRGIGLNNLKMAGYEKLIEFHNLPSYIALPNLEERKIKIDFAFIDGVHTFDYTLIDFFYIDRMLRVGGMVVLDDVGLPGVKKVCKYILTNRAYSLAGYWGPIKDITPERKISRLIKSVLSPWLNRQRIAFLVKWGVFRGIRCIAFRKESEDIRDWAYHRDF